MSWDRLETRIGELSSKFFGMDDKDLYGENREYLGKATAYATVLAIIKEERDED